MLDRGQGKVEEAADAVGRRARGARLEGAAGEPVAGSEPGVGSTFSLELPATPEDSPEETAPSLPGSVASSVQR